MLPADQPTTVPGRYNENNFLHQVVVLCGAKDRPVGVASMRFFDANGSLAMGLQKRPFQFTYKLPFAWDPAAPPSGKEPGDNGVWCGGRGGSWSDQLSGDEIPKEDWGFRLERVRASSVRHQRVHTISLSVDWQGGDLCCGKCHRASGLLRKSACRSIMV